VQVFSLGGQYDGTSLEGLVSVLVNYPRRSFEAPRPYLLYVSDDASPSQLDAVSGLFAGPFHLPPVKAIERAPIRLSSGEAFQKVSIPGILEYEIVKPSGAGASQLDPGVEKYTYSWLHDAEQWSVRKLTLTLGEERTAYRRTNAIMARLLFPGQDGQGLSTDPPAWGLSKE
jgi:hypothetical protein